MRFEIVFRGVIKGSGGSVPPTVGLEQFLDEFMDALDEGGATDPALGADVSTGEIELSVIADSVDPQTAIAVSGQAIGVALDVAGGVPPGWGITWTETHAAAAEELAGT